MKMKKTYAAALAAAMVLTAGLSAQAEDLTINTSGSASITWENWRPTGIEVTTSGTVTGAEVAASLEGQDVNLHDVTASLIQTSNGAQLGGGANITGGATVTAKEGDETALTVNGGADVNGDANVTGNATVGGTLDAGNITGDEMHVSAGNASLDVGNNYIQSAVGGNSVSINGDGVSVNGGAVTVNQDGMEVNTNTTFSGDATFSGGATFNDTITGMNGAEITGTTTIHGDEYVDGTMTADKIVTNNGATINGGATVNGGAAVNGGLTVDGVNFADVANQADKAEAKADGALKVQGNGVLYNHGTDLTTGINLNTTAIEQEAKDREQGDAQLQQSIDATQAQVEKNTQKISSFDGRLNSLDSKVSDLGDEIDNVGAISSALAGLHPLDYDGTGSKFQLAAAMGSYDGTQAAAIGGFYHFNEDIMMSVGGATSFGGDNKSAFNVGLSFRVGQGSSGKRVSNDEVLAQLTAMNDKIAALEAENQQLSEKVAALEGGEGAEAAEAE